MTITFTLFASLGFLAAAAVVHDKVRRLAAETPVMATVARAWSEPAKGGPVYYARLIFDRKQHDGGMVHCDVPRVSFGQQSTRVGATIKVAPRVTTCWEPDVICETCTAPSDTVTFGMLAAAAVFGLICWFVVRSTLREIKYGAA
jgi:hypothetical protein